MAHVNVDLQRFYNVCSVSELCHSDSAKLPTIIAMAFYGSDAKVKRFQITDVDLMI